MQFPKPGWTVIHYEYTAMYITPGPVKVERGGDACMPALHLTLLARSGQPGAPTVLSTPRWGFYDAVFEQRVPSPTTFR